MFSFVRIGVLLALIGAGQLGIKPFDMAPDAHAHGKHMNLTQYCKTKYEKGLWPLPWRAEYVKDRPDSGIWYCKQSKRQGLNTMMGGSEIVIDPAKACLAQHKTSRIHFHEGTDPAQSHNMHCGLFTGTVPLPSPAQSPPAESAEDRAHAIIEVCNETKAEKIAVGFAFRDYKKGRFQSQGWWPVAKGQCFNFNLPAANAQNSPYREAAYILGYHSKARLKGNGSDICINMGQPFMIDDAKNADTCLKANNQTMMEAMKLDIKGGKNTHTYTD